MSLENENDWIAGLVDDQEDHSPEDAINLEDEGLEESPEKPNTEETSGDDAKTEKREEGKKESDKSSQKKPEGEDDKEKQPESNNEIARLEKRIHDNQAAYTKEHQERLRLEKRIAELEKDKSTQPEKKPSENQNEEEDWFSGDETQEQENDKPQEQSQTDQKKINERLDSLEQRLEQERQEEALKRWDAASEEVKKNHDDFDEVVYEILAPQLEDNPQLQAKFQEMGGTPEAAYKLGQVLETVSNPEKAKERIRKEIESETKKEGTSQGNKPPDLGLDNSRTPDSNDTSEEKDDLLDFLDR